MVQVSFFDGHSGPNRGEQLFLRQQATSTLHEQTKCGKHLVRHRDLPGVSHQATSAGSSLKGPNGYTLSASRNLHI